MAKGTVASWKRDTCFCVTNLAQTCWSPDADTEVCSQNKIQENKMVCGDRDRVNSEKHVRMILGTRLIVTNANQMQTKCKPQTKLKQSHVSS